jgi:phosphoribosylglycinamide formyltransferase 1
LTDSSGIRIGILISGSGSNMDAIIAACETGRINGRVVFVGSDNPDAKGLEKAAAKKISTFVVPYADIINRLPAAADGIWNAGAADPTAGLADGLPLDFHLKTVRDQQRFFPPDADFNKVNRFLCTRAAAEAALLKRMNEYPFDLLVLAGFMRNLTPYFIDRVNTEPGRPRIMNIHPALLPAFPGVDGYGDTVRYGCKVGGCTVHFIDYGEDSGPIIGQRAFAITETDSLDAVRKKGLGLEWELYPECIQLFAQGRLHVVRMTYTLDNGSICQRNIVKIAQTAKA